MKLSTPIFNGLQGAGGTSLLQVEDRVSISYCFCKMRITTCNLRNPKLACESNVSAPEKGSKGCEGRDYLDCIWPYPLNHAQRHAVHQWQRGMRNNYDPSKTSYIFGDNGRVFVNRRKRVHA